MYKNYGHRGYIHNKNRATVTFCSKYATDLRIGIIVNPKKGKTARQIFKYRTEKLDELIVSQTVNCMKKKRPTMTINCFNGAKIVFKIPNARLLTCFGSVFFFSSYLCCKCRLHSSIGQHGCPDDLTGGDRISYPTTGTPAVQLERINVYNLRNNRRYNIFMYINKMKNFICARSSDGYCYLFYNFYLVLSLGRRVYW